MIKQPHEMLFAEFALAARPTGAVNRWPQIGSGADVLTYSVYMNGPLADRLPNEAREVEYKDVMLHALTDKLGLDSEYFRDNMKVAELVATRNAWMAAVLESTMGRDGAPVAILSEEVTRDYELLTRGLSHPWLREQVEAQRALSRSLGPALRSAESVTHGAVEEQVPDVVNTGIVVSQNDDFTVQQVGNGRVVAHENQKLGGIPPKGENVVIVYYRGEGQVFPNSKELDISHPFVDPITDKLSVLVTSADKSMEQQVLFNSVRDYERFVGAQGLSYALVNEAMALSRASGRAVPLSGPSKEDAHKPLGVVDKLTKEVIETGQKLGCHLDQEKLSRLLEYGRGTDGLFIGKVLKVDERHGLVYQATGPNKGEVHRLSALSRVPAVNEIATIRMKDGRGQVEGPAQRQGREGR